jgi:DDE family transposase
MTTERPTRDEPDFQTKVDARHLVIDFDSKICEVAGKRKTGAGFGYSKALENHPILDDRADTGEGRHARLRNRSANTTRGTKRFLEELIARLQRPGATGEMVVRFDSDYSSNDTIATLGPLNVHYTMAVPSNHRGSVEAVVDVHRLFTAECSASTACSPRPRRCSFHG